jgi:hypothetical protein
MLAKVGNIECLCIGYMVYALYLVYSTSRKAKEKPDKKYGDEKKLLCIHGHWFWNCLKTFPGAVIWNRGK